MAGLRKLNLERAKKTLAKQDLEKAINEKIKFDEKIDKLDKRSMEQKEKDAARKLRKMQIRKGLKLR